MTRVAVVGGGISGLAAAWDLVKSSGTEVTLVEAATRLGGKIASGPFAGVEMDTGPDAFLARVPAAAELAREAGLGGELVVPATGQAWLWTRAGLRPLPTGLVLGVPGDLGALARSRILPRRAVARAALDLVLPGRPLGEDEDVAVGALVRARLGRAVQMGLVDPLLGGINAGHTDGLSAAVAAPVVLAAARRDRSLLRGLRAGGTTGDPSGAVRAGGNGTGGGPGTAGGRETGGGPGETGGGAPVFWTVRGGLGRLVAALAAGIRRAPGAEVVTGDGVAALLPGPIGWTVRLSSGRHVEADAVVLTCPAPDTARLLRAVSPGAAATLGSIDTASVVMTLLAYPGSAVAVPRPGSGFLVPRSERRLVTAASWVGAKWPHLASPDRLVVRASSGRIDDRRAMELDDDELVEAVQGELTSAMDLVGPPAEAQVHRWEDAFPQYAPGHLDRIDQAERRLALDAPGVVLAGAALRGVGIATCIAGARAAAARVLGQVAARPARR